MLDVRARSPENGETYVSERLHHPRPVYRPFGRVPVLDAVLGVDGNQLLRLHTMSLYIYKSS